MNRFSIFLKIYKFALHTILTQEHLACFVPGMLALGSKNGFGSEDLEVAKKMAHTCVMMYFNTPTGLSPEVATMNTHSKTSKEDMFVGVSLNAMLYPFQ